MDRLLTKYAADLVMSLGAFQCLIDNYPHNINRQWELAVAVKEYDVIGQYYVYLISQSQNGIIKILCPSTK